MTALSDVLNRSIEQRFGRDISNRELARKSGGALSRATIDKYRRGGHGDPTPEVLAAFHELTGASLVEMRQAAGQMAGESEPWIPPKEADLMSRRQRRAVAELIRSFVAREALDESEDLPNWGSGFRPPPPTQDPTVRRDQQRG